MNEHVYRVVVDSWPTPDGLPFDHQLIDWEDVPKWMPETAPMDMFLTGDDLFDGHSYQAPHWNRWKWLARSGAKERVALLAKFGVTAHIERALIGEWA